MSAALALNLLLSVALATPPVAPDPSSCAADDLRCTGQANAAAARSAKSGEQRALYLYSAHRAFLRLFDDSQDAGDLCRAHDLIRQARKLPATELGPRLADSERETLSRLRSSGVECSRGRASPRARPAEVASERAPAPTPAPVIQPRPEAGPAAGSSAAPSPAPSPALVPAVDPTWRQTQAGADPARSAASAPPSLAQVEHGAARPARPARPLLIGGGVALGISLVLGGLTVYFPTRALTSRRGCINDMCATDTGEVGKYERYLAGGREYDRNLKLGVLTGVTGGAALVTAIVLLSVGARRKPQGLAVAPMIHRGAGGVLFTGRF